MALSLFRASSSPSILAATSVAPLPAAGGSWSPKETSLELQLGLGSPEEAPDGPTTVALLWEDLDAPLLAEFEPARHPPSAWTAPSCGENSHEDQGHRKLARRGKLCS